MNEYYKEKIVFVILRGGFYYYRVMLFGFCNVFVIF